MAQAKKVVSKKEDTLASLKTVAPVKKATKNAELVLTKGMEPITHKTIKEWVDKNAGGSTNNVEVVPLDNLKVDKPHPAPFGYNSPNPNGPTPTIMNMHVHGVGGSFNLGKILHEANMFEKKRSNGKQGHSQMRATVMLLNGGESRSPCRDKAEYCKDLKGKPTFGTSYIKLRSLV